MSGVMQGMAGQIVHAIASTNATISGLIVLEALKLLSNQPHSCKVTLTLTEEAFSFRFPLKKPNLEDSAWSQIQQ